MSVACFKIALLEMEVRQISYGERWDIHEEFRGRVATQGPFDCVGLSEMGFVCHGVSFVGNDCTVVVRKKITRPCWPDSAGVRSCDNF